MENGERARWRPGHPDVYRHDVAYAAGRRGAGADQPAAYGVGPHRHDDPRLWHGVVSDRQRPDHPGRASTRDQEQVGMSWAGGEKDAEPVHVVDRAEQRSHLPLIGAVRACIHMTHMDRPAQSSDTPGQVGARHSPRRLRFPRLEVRPGQPGYGGPPLERERTEGARALEHATATEYALALVQSRCRCFTFTCGDGAGRASCRYRRSRGARLRRRGHHAALPVGAVAVGPGRGSAGEHTVAQPRVTHGISPPPPPWKGRNSLR